METIQLREKRSPGARCAYCHGSLGDTTEVLQCTRCHVELHKDCREALGRCPTLGCATRALAPTDLPRLRFSRNLTSPLSRRSALAGLYTPTALSGVLTGFFALVIVLMCVTWVVVLASAGMRPGGGIVLGAVLLPFVGVAFYLGWLCSTNVRALIRARRLLATETTGEERQLIVWETPFGRRITGLEADEGQEGPAWVPVQLDSVLAQEHEGRIPVRVRGLGGQGALVIEHEDGRLQIARRLTHPEIRPPGLRNWRPRSRTRE